MFVLAIAAGIFGSVALNARQSTQSAAGSSTADALIIVEGQHRDAQAEITRATHDLVGFLSQYQPQADLTSAILSPDSPEFPAGDVAP